MHAPKFYDSIARKRKDITLFAEEWTYISRAEKEGEEEEDMHETNEIL